MNPKLKLTMSKIVLLKKGHMYYTQIQLNMFVCGAKSAEMFIFSQQSFSKVTVPFDEEFCQTLLKKLEKNFFTVLLPALSVNPVSN